MAEPAVIAEEAVRWALERGRALDALAPIPEEQVKQVSAEARCVIEVLAAAVRATPPAIRATMGRIMIRGLGGSA